jgi:hypothetical protein
MNRTRSRVTFLLLGAVGAGLMMSGQAEAVGRIGLLASLPFDETCANDGQLRLAPVTNADFDLGREALSPCHDG